MSCTVSAVEILGNMPDVNGAYPKTKAGSNCYFEKSEGVTMPIKFALAGCVAWAG